MRHLLSLGIAVRHHDVKRRIKYFGEEYIACVLRHTEETTARYNGRARVVVINYTEQI